MKAITIWQPWASLIMAEAKPYEFRGWVPPASVQGQRIGVHAGARKVRPAELYDLILRLKSPAAWSTGLRKDIALPLLEEWLDRPQRLPLSSILGTAVLGKPVRSTKIVAELGGPVNDSDRDDHSNYAWPLTDVQRLEPIVPMKGAQGFWRCG